MFRDRQEAGAALAERVAGLNLVDPVVYALPRGGVPVAAEIARRLAAPLDLLFVRKIGAPGFPEVALGAVVDEEQLLVNEDVYAATGSDAHGLARARRRELDEIDRRRARYLGARAPIDPAGRVAVVVDDGLATGATARVALRALRARGAARLVLAAPVAPADLLPVLRAEADEVVILLAPADLWSIGRFYRDFHQLSDDETIELLRAAWAES